MSGSHARIVARETVISMVINATISALMTWLLFGGAADGVERGAVIVDFAPQTFMVALMGSLVPSAIVLRTIRRAAAGSLPATPIRTLLLRCVMIALLATCVLGGTGVLLAVVLLDAQIGFRTLIVIKMLYGALVAALVTPLALVLALRQPS